ncbi:MAG TPA: type III pantothenate kinase [Bryobacteraceae bacterium]|nr:type III pantothenate kinase [Bryobacteraceae bacterium]
MSLEACVLLALDAGNTNLTIGAFEFGKLTANWRLRTVHEQTADEWGVLVRGLLSLANIDFEKIDAIVVASVVPPMNAALSQMAQRYFETDAFFVTHETDIGLKILYDDPREVGADRLVNGVAALSKYGGPCIVVDMGTAITFDAISAGAEYLGGIISAGIGISIDALFARTARLPRVEFREPEKLIGTNTVGSVQSGLFYGALSLIDGTIERLVQELGNETKVVGTGGQAGLIAPQSKYLKTIDENLTLDGLEIIWTRHARP